MNKFNLFLLLSFLAAPLNACSSTKEQFDFSKKAPDEFAVMTRAPLEMPANYDLPPPRPGAARPQESAPDEQAKQALFGEEKQRSVTELTEGEAILLQKTRATESNSNIRDIVDAETIEVIKDSTSTFNKLIGKAGKKIDAPATVVDPIKESERLLQNKKAGKPVTEGETPSLDQ